MNDRDKKHLTFLMSQNPDQLREYLNTCEPEMLLYSLALLDTHYKIWFADPLVKVKKTQKEDLSIAKEYLKKFMLNKT